MGLIRPLMGLIRPFKGNSVRLLCHEALDQHRAVTRAGFGQRRALKNHDFPLAFFVSLGFIRPLRAL